MFLPPAERFGSGDDVHHSPGCEGFRTIGIDYSETAIVLARKNAAEAGLHVVFHVGDCLRLEGIDSGTMDLVVDNHALHCIVERRIERRSSLESARRVLKPSGRFFSETMSCEGSFDAAKDQRGPGDACCPQPDAHSG